MRLNNFVASQSKEIRDSFIGENSNLPALSELTQTEKNPKMVNSILITHILHTAVEYVKIINEIYPVKGIIAIPYSADKIAVEQLKSEGFNIVVPDSVQSTFTKSEEMALNYLTNNNEPLIIQEVGGYLAKSTTKLSEYKNFLGIVEDTNNGHWLYEQTAPHNCPILSMAQSPLKFVEDTIIGDAIIFSLERILREEYSGILQGMRVGVIGFGKIGRSSAVALKGRESVVSIYDINPTKNMSAKVEGFYPLPLYELLSETDIIIGCTGQTSIRLVDLPYIKAGTILVSGSSKNIEFDLTGFSTKCTVTKINEVITKYTRTADNKSFYVLTNGTPVNFRDKSILGAILDMIYCELFVCLREVVNGKVEIGLQKSKEHIQNEVSKAWLRAHSIIFSNAPEDKVWDYPESLKLGLPK